MNMVLVLENGCELELQICQDYSSLFVNTMTVLLGFTAFLSYRDKTEMHLLFVKSNILIHS